MIIASWPTDRPIPYARNARKISPVAVDKVASSIKEFGWRQPIVVDGEGVVIAGHTRLLAAKKLSLPEVPVHVADGLSKQQVKAYRLMDNRSHEEAEWDKELLGPELLELEALDIDLALTGFDPDELAMYTVATTEGLTDEDAVPEVPVDPVTRLGDLWVLGNHRLLCGDSTSVDAVERLMDGQKADMVFTDPPYGMSYGGGRGRVGSSDGTVKSFGVILGDDKRGKELVDMVRSSLTCAATQAKSGSSWYVCFPWRTYPEFEDALRSVELMPKACIVWDKKSIGLGTTKGYRPQHEFIFYIAGGAWYGDKSQSDVWYQSRGATVEYVHPTQKPVELIERALGNSSKAGDLVLDLFGGSGSTLIACEKTGRHARLMELDPKYCDVIVKRWQDFTGKEAHLEDGTTFAQLEAKRNKKKPRKTAS